MNTFLQKIKDSLWYFKNHYRLVKDEEINKIAHPTQQTDIRQQEIRKRIINAFNQQKQRMDLMAMKQHEPDCDVMTCKKQICFIRRPDKIVSIENIDNTVKSRIIKTAKKNKQLIKQMDRNK